MISDRTRPICGYVEGIIDGEWTWTGTGSRSTYSLDLGYGKGHGAGEAEAGLIGQHFIGRKGTDAYPVGTRCLAGPASGDHLCAGRREDCGLHWRAPAIAPFPAIGNRTRAVDSDNCRTTEVCGTGAGERWW